MAPLVVLLASGTAVAGQAVGELAFDPPAEFRGRHLAVVLPGPSYLAAYDVGDRSVAGVTFDLQMGSFARIEYEQAYIWSGPAGYGGVPSTERYGRQDLGEVRSISIVETLRNFTLILRLDSGAVFELSNGTINAPLSSGLLMSKGTRPDSLEPNLNEDPWQANFLDVPLEGPPRHHVLSSEATFAYDGSVEVTLSHAVIDVLNETGKHRILLDTHLRFEGAGPNGIAPEPVARYNGSMLRGTGTGGIVATVQAPFVRLLEPRPTLMNVEMLAAPVADGRLAAADGSHANIHNRSHLDVAGNFSVQLHPPQMSSGGHQAIVSSLEGDVVGFAVDRAPFEPFGVPTVVAVASGLGVLVVVHVVVSSVRRGVFAAMSSKVHLALLGWFPFSAKLEDWGVLAHPVRKELLAILGEEVGPLRLRDLQKRARERLGASRFLTYYHLRVLARGRVLSVHQRAKRGAVFVAAADPSGSPWARVSMVLTSPLGRLVGRTVVESPGVSQAEITRRVQKWSASNGVPRPPSRAAVYKWLRQLENAGVRPREGGRRGGQGRAGAAGPGLIRRIRTRRQVTVWPEPALVAAFAARSSAMTRPRPVESPAPREFPGTTFVNRPLNIA